MVRAKGPTSTQIVILVGLGTSVPHPELVVWAAEGCRHVLYSCDTPEIQLLYSVVLTPFRTFQAKSRIRTQERWESERSCVLGGVRTWRLPHRDRDSADPFGR